MAHIGGFVAGVVLVNIFDAGSRRPGPSPDALTHRGVALSRLPRSIIVANARQQSNGLA